jgi:hypothetical protein
VVNIVRGKRSKLPILDDASNLKGSDNMEIVRMIVMRAEETANGLMITEEAILNSLDTFINKPIVFNDKQTLKDYTVDEMVDKYNSEHVMGIILGNLELKDGKVYADVAIWDNYPEKFKPEYDNWCIQLNDDKKSFTLCSVEFF